MYCMGPKKENKRKKEDSFETFNTFIYLHITATLLILIFDLTFTSPAVGRASD